MLWWRVKLPRLVDAIGFGVLGGVAELAISGDVCGGVTDYVTILDNGLILGYIERGNFVTTGYALDAEHAAEIGPSANILEREQYVILAF